MEYEIHYLPFVGTDENGDPLPAREMDHKMAIDDHTPTQEEFEDLWEKQTEGTLDSEDVDSHEDALSQLWRAYNRAPDGYHPEMDEKEMRSLSKNDIVIINGTPYLCASVGWEEVEW